MGVDTKTLFLPKFYLQMIDANSFNKAFEQIVEQRNKLYKMNYNDDGYDDIEDTLHDLEDDFNADFEEYLTDILENAHGAVKSDADVLLPTAYIASYYQDENETDPDGAKVFSIPTESGVYVECEGQAESTDTRIVFMPSPARLMFLVNNALDKELWRVK